MKQIMKLVVALLVVALAAPVANAQFGGLKNRVKQQVKSKVSSEISRNTNPSTVVSEVTQRIPEKSDAQSKGEVTVGDLTVKFDGKINHDKWNKSQKSTITFNRFPATLDEFNAVREVLAREPQGAAALMVMAMELYNRDHEAGIEALKATNTTTNYNSAIGRVKEMYGTDENYARPYLTAALLKGAVNTNAYTPNEPYQIKVRVNPVTQYQDSEFLDGTVIYLQIDGAGWDTNWRGVEVVRPDGEELYVVSNCPALYTQCKKIKGKYAGLK